MVFFRPDDIDERLFGKKRGTRKPETFTANGSQGSVEADPSAAPVLHESFSHVNKLLFMLSLVLENRKSTTPHRLPLYLYVPCLLSLDGGGVENLSVAYFWSSPVSKTVTKPVRRSRGSKRFSKWAQRRAEFGFLERLSPCMLRARRSGLYPAQWSAWFKRGLFVFPYRCPDGFLSMARLAPWVDVAHGNPTSPPELIPAGPLKWLIVVGPDGVRFTIPRPPLQPERTSCPVSSFFWNIFGVKLAMKR